MASGFLLRLDEVLVSFLEKRMGTGPLSGGLGSMLTASSRVERVTAGQASQNSLGSFLREEAIPGSPWRSSLSPPSHARMAQRMAGQVRVFDLLLVPEVQKFFFASAA